jgi:hypothetical protein
MLIVQIAIKHWPYRYDAQKDYDAHAKQDFILDFAGV